jgi:hypothetical protein
MVEKRGAFFRGAVGEGDARRDQINAEEIGATRYTQGVVFGKVSSE